MEDYLGIAQATSTRNKGPVAPWDDDVLEDSEESSPSSLGSSEVIYQPFIDLCKRRFLWYFNSYLNTIDEEASKWHDESDFSLMPFEHPGNCMAGSFQYGKLRKRLWAVKEAISDETRRWAMEGKEAQQAERGKAANLLRQFEQVLEYNKNTLFHLQMELVDANPFVWQLTLFGKPVTKLEGGIFRITICVSPRFPIEQPRVTVNTPIFHNRVAEDGCLCYFVQKPEDMKAHIAAIVEALEEESCPYDPRTIVRPEASKLYWGSSEEKKLYSRRLRRSVEASMDP